MYAVKQTDEELIESLKAIIKSIEDQTFEGVLFFSNAKEDSAFVKAVKGDASDRVACVDAAFMSMYEEPIEESKQWFLDSIYKRFKYYFGKTHEAELATKRYTV